MFSHLFAVLSSRVRLLHPKDNRFKRLLDKSLVIRLTRPSALYNWKQHSNRQQPVSSRPNDITYGKWQQGHLVLSIDHHACLLHSLPNLEVTLSRSTF